MAVTHATLTQAQLRTQMTGFLGLKRFDVTHYGAVGDGVTNDQAAIQAAYDAAYTAGGGEIWFPNTGSSYKINTSVVYDEDDVNFAFVGEPGALVVGNFADYLFKRPLSVAPGPTSGIHVFRNLRLQQNHASGGAIAANALVGATIENCRIAGPGGLIAGSTGIACYNSQSLAIRACSILGFGVGIQSGNATTIDTTDVSGCLKGIVHQNLGLIVSGGRFEVNGTAILIGEDENGNAFQSSGFAITGTSMESNDHGIYVRQGADGLISGNAVSSNVAGKTSGIYLDTSEQVALIGNGVSNVFSFSAAGIYFNNPLRTLVAANRINVASGTAWRLPVSGEILQMEFRANTPVVEWSVTVAQLATYGGPCPISTMAHVSNSNVATGKITGTGANDVMAIKIDGNEWVALCVGT